MADPGYPRGGGANPKGGVPTYYLANFSRILHENEEILGQRGGARPLRPPLDPPLLSRSDKIYFFTFFFSQSPFVVDSRRTLLPFNLLLDDTCQRFIDVHTVFPFRPLEEILKFTFTFGRIYS